MSASFDAGRDAALRFLQTVVVIDDHAYKDPPQISVAPATLGNESIVEEEVTDVAAAADNLVDLQDFETEVVVEAFADLGIYCAVLAPDAEQQGVDARRIEQLARRSDIMILDWILRPRDVSDARTAEPGERTSVNLLLGVMREDASGGGRTRLICIYTGEPDARGILDKIRAAIEGENPGATIVDGAGHWLDYRSTRIVVLGKEREVPVASIESVASSALPNRVVDEFTRFVATGILREIALDSLSAVRDESHRLLRRFHGGLDFALLSHRSVTSPALAEQFARSLVGSELGAIILAANVTGALADERVNEVIDTAFAGRTEALYWPTPTAAAASSKKLPADVAVKALKLGVDKDDYVLEAGNKLSRRVSRTALLLTGDDASVRTRSLEIDAGFSMLSALARDPSFDGIGSPAPAMQLGTIISRFEADTSRPANGDAGHGDSPQPHYWVCLQPLCDSVRLTGATMFPMLPLKLGGERFNYVVMFDGRPLMLQHQGLKLSEMSLMSFVPQRGADIVDASWSGQAWKFTSEDGVSYEWAGSLRLDKAHKLLHSVVSTAGRIGIDEYEYLRQSAPGPTD